MSEEKLENLRHHMKTITHDIISLINERMKIAKEIGEIKNKLNLNVVDDRIEQEIKNYILKETNGFGLDPEFLGRVINLLINESVNIQKTEKNKIQNTKNNIRTSSNAFSNTDKILQSEDQKVLSSIKIRTHMDVFNKAKMLDSMGREIIHMEVGEPDFSPPIRIKDELESIYNNHRYHYTESAGIIDLRTKLSEYLNQYNNDKLNELNAQNIIATVGGRFALFCTFSSLLRPGDEIIIIEPAWPAYKDCANYMGIKAKVINTTLDQKWEPDITLIENAININTKIICLNYPNNPTGKILDDNKMRDIIEIAKEYNLFILSDEVYCNYTFKRFSSILKYSYNNSIMIGSFSKTYSMTGFRVGFASSLNKDIINKLIKIQSLSLTSVAEPMQLCALAALSFNPLEFNQIIKKRIDLVCSRLKSMPFEFYYPDGAMYVYAKINEDLDIDDLTLIENLLQRGVAVAPGSGFGESYKNYIRISTCIDEEKLHRGLDILEQMVNPLK
ncbi:MAG: aminotransferase class I/II-fold pyridoxal phosphate-dependent enzyme [Candidatus Nitrosocosmicus sp.]